MEKWNNNFTIMHIVAAIMVILGHQFVLMGYPNLCVFDNTVHGLGVSILFLVSGFLVSQSYFRTKNNKYGCLKFLIKRISRLYPPLFLCMILTALFLWFVSDKTYDYWISAIKYVIDNILMKPKYYIFSVFENNPYPKAVNGSLWTLPFELACYFLVVVVLKIYYFIETHTKNLKFVINRTICICFWALILLALSTFDTLKYLNIIKKPIMFYGLNWLNITNLIIWFFWGVAISSLKNDKIINIQSAIMLLIAYICCTPTVKHVLEPYVIGYLVISFCLIEKPIFANIKRDICYGLYLYAFPIQQLIIYIFYVKFHLQLNVYVYFLVSVTITWLFAEMSYYFIENRSTIRKLKNKKH